MRTFIEQGMGEKLSPRDKRVTAAGREPERRGKARSPSSAGGQAAGLRAVQCSARQGRAGSMDHGEGPDGRSNGTAGQREERGEECTTVS